MKENSWSIIARQPAPEKTAHEKEIVEKRKT